MAYKSRAIPDLSSIQPIKINIGMAKRTKLFAFVKVLLATMCKACGPHRK
jgi:hypothetical protein